MTCEISEDWLIKTYLAYLVLVIELFVGVEYLCECIKCITTRSRMGTNLILLFIECYQEIYNGDNVFNFLYAYLP